MNVVLVGFMGSGKSKVGKLLAEKTGRTLVEIDELTTATKTVGEIFAAEGEAGFRKRERAATAKAARTANAIISTGGGTVLDDANVRALKKNGVIVYLKAEPSELVRRLTKSKRERPLLKGHDIPARVNQLLGERGPIYESVADVIVSSDVREPTHVVDEIVRKLSLNGATKATRVRVGTKPPYTVHVGRGQLEHLRDLVRLPKRAEKAVIVSHPRLRRLHGAKVEAGLKGLDHSWATFPEGEESKTLATAAKLTEALAKTGLHRDDVVVALGGGVVGDVGGFVASTFGRGVAVVQLPTTLLAMVDSSIGGKTGVNLPQGKNLVGTFHQPLAVIADLETIATLPERELRGGIAEVVKYGFIADQSLARTMVSKRDEIYARGDVLQTIVAKCARIKAEVVSEDERDKGLRAILNYGHTLGHAIELLSDLHHGEAISVGMVYAAEVARLMGMSDFTAQHRDVLNAVGLPTTIAGLTWKRVRERMIMDKKYAKGDRLVLLEELGKPVVRDVAPDILEGAWKAVAG